MSFFKDIALIGKASSTIEGLQKYVAELQSQLNHLQGEHQNTSEENELILSQLHEVQEEFEHYYLDYQKAKQQQELNEQRLGRIMSTSPNFFNYETINYAESDSYPKRIHWKISDLITAGSQWNVLEFDTVIEHGVLGVIFAQDDEGNSPLAFWPNDYLNQDELECIPAGTPEKAKERALLLGALSASDWQLLTTLPRLLVHAIEQKKVEIDNKVAWLEALSKTLDILENHLPKKLRFDGVELLNHLERQGYEHLHLRLHNLVYGNVHHKKFEFKLGCANVTNNALGTHPRLEFSLVEGKPQLESWYPESEDEFGPKLELRFAAPADIDINVWKEISLIDKELLIQLINFLPRILKSVTGVSLQLKQDLHKWSNYSRLIQQILSNHL